MPQTIMVIPAGFGVGLFTAMAGLVRAIENMGIKVAFLKPVLQHETEIEESKTLVPPYVDPSPEPPLTLEEVEVLLSEGRQNEIIDNVLERYEHIANTADVIIVEGLRTSATDTYSAKLNNEIAQALDAHLILVTTPAHARTCSLIQHLELVSERYGGINNPRLLGCIINRIGAPLDESGQPRLDLGAQIAKLETTNDQKTDKQYCTSLEKAKVHIKVIGCIHWHLKLVAPRVLDIARALDAEIISAGDYEKRRVYGISIFAQDVAHIFKVLQPHTLIVTPGDRTDVILATCMAVISGIPLAGLLLTGGFPFDERLKKLCESAIATGFPLLAVKTNSLRTAIALQNQSPLIPSDDIERLEFVKNYVARRINTDPIKALLASHTHIQPLLSPHVFRHQLNERAKRVKKTIVLPEGTDPRIIEAAATHARRDTVHCVLLGKPKAINRVAKQHGLVLDNVDIIDPETVRSNYVDLLVKLRKHKGMTPVLAKEQLLDNVVLGTMMLCDGEVDGLVAGANTTTANALRPALQIIKTAPDAKLVSSIFFMCLPTQILLYGDCALNPNPNAEELADIAVQSADSAAVFGIIPKVAMISYSSGKSGSGEDVDKVREATQLVKAMRPDLLIDGPLQYDAAINELIAKKKAPKSPVAGHANVIIFPDLNTGNTTYKAVERSADVDVIGPMMQGFNKPVNDLSRGATAQTIGYTIALTAIQAQEGSGK